MNWIDYVKQVQNEKRISYKEALSVASKTYKKGGSIKSNYIKHILYDPTKFNLNKMNGNVLSNFIKDGKYFHKHNQLYNENENIINRKKTMIDNDQNIINDYKHKQQKQQHKNYSYDEVKMFLNKLSLKYLRGGIERYFAMEKNMTMSNLGKQKKEKLIYIILDKYDIDISKYIKYLKDYIIWDKFNVDTDEDKYNDLYHNLSNHIPLFKMIE